MMLGLGGSLITGVLAVLIKIPQICHERHFVLKFNGMSKEL